MRSCCSFLGHLLDLPFLCSAAPSFLPPSRSWSVVCQSLSDRCHESPTIRRIVSTKERAKKRETMDKDKKKVRASLPYFAHSTTATMEGTDPRKSPRRDSNAKKPKPHLFDVFRSRPKAESDVAPPAAPDLRSFTTPLSAHDKIPPIIINALHTITQNGLSTSPPLPLLLSFLVFLCLLFVCFCCCFPFRCLCVTDKKKKKGGMKTKGLFRESAPASLVEEQIKIYESGQSCT